MKNVLIFLNKIMRKSEINFKNSIAKLVFLQLISYITICRAQYLPPFAAPGVGPSESIPIGLISDLNADDQRKIFDYAISVANTDLGIPLTGQQEVIEYGNSLEGFGRLCGFMEAGIGAIFGPTSKNAAKHLLNVCDAKDIPFIYPHMSEDSEGFNLHPHPMDIARVLKAIIEEYEWQQFIFLYENSDYLSILNSLLSFYVTEGPVVTILRYDLKLNGNYKSVLRRVRKSKITRILVVGSTPSVAEVLNQAQQVGIVNDKYNYLIGNLDLHTFDLEEYKYSEANITGIRMFSAEQPEVEELMLQLGYYEYETENIKNGSCPITMEMALTYDAVQVVAEVTKHLIYHPQPLNCSDKNDNVQPDGSTFKNYMRSLDMTEKLLTGRIFFDGHIRKGFTFDIIELQEMGLIKIGTWDERKNLTINRPPPMNEVIDVGGDLLANKTFVVLINVPNKPYASLVNSHERLIGNSQYEGYSIDVIKELAEILGFNFTFKNFGSDYGTFNKTNNRTTGMLKEIAEGRADLAIADLTITSERQEAVDFSIPFMNLGIGILFLKPKKAEPALFSFMDPFSGEVWMYLGFAYFGVSLSLFILGRLSPTEWDNPYPCIEEPEELENQFTLNNAVWFTTGALLQQGSEIAPKALSTRTVSTIWWFFTLIIVSSYTANLAAFLTIEKPSGLIDDVKDLAENKGGVRYGAKRNGATRNFFLTSEDPTYRQMDEYMASNPDLLTESNQEGVQKVLDEDRYAFLMESTSIEYNTVRNCDLMKIGEPLDEKGYGIAMKKEWEYRDRFNNALLALQEQGTLAKLKNKWWNEIGAGVCNAKSEGADAHALDMKNLGGVYLVLAVGSAFSIVFGILSWIYMVIVKAIRYEVSFMDALKEEWSVVIDFQNNERELKGPTSVYSRRNSLMSIDSLETDPENEEQQSDES